MGRRGFTLIELLVVMAVFGLVVAVSFPALGKLRSSIFLEVSARKLASELRLSQVKAVACGESVNYHPNSVNLAQGIVLSNDKEFIFSRSGYTQPGGSGTQKLATKSGQEKSIVVSSVGRVRIE
ncbi:MAG: prepilin-type N-terminal cleavage/methylation domain-containing protein [Candidatus Margulisbacteria bacterium]|nr:prepilin-type N-terminal cleavage/methylation domain-containing protein [Candidatus Margulisiibacteriota bacterium]